MTATPEAVVHVIPGTWARGIGRRRRPAQPEWFELGSSFLGEIEELVGLPIEFRIFEWSFRNSAFDRVQAGDDLAAKLSVAHEERPDIPHVIVAHSHGGAVALRALQPRGLRGGPPVKALICLSTPFVYVTTAPAALRPLAPAALSALISGCVTATLAFSAVSLPWLVLGVLLSGVLLHLVLNSLHEMYVPKGRDSLLPMRFAGPLFVLRSTRDEATMAMGLAQAVHRVQAVLMGLFYRMGTRRSWTTRFVEILLFGLALSLLIWSIPGLGAIFSERGIIYGGVLIASLAPAVVAALYLFAYAALALSAGLLDPRHWGSTHVIEVEPAPPDQICEFRSYTNMGNVLASLGAEGYQVGSADGKLRPTQPIVPFLQHSVYELPEVRQDIARIVLDVIRGREPTLSRSALAP